MRLPDLYQQVTDQIVTELEKGVAPWVRPWRRLSDEFGGAPHNAFSKRAYRGVNAILLSMTMGARGLGDPRWLTYRQALALGGNVRKGEKSTQVVFWKPVTVAASPKPGEVESEKSIPILRSYSVFNVEQCDGVPPLEGAIEGDPLIPHRKALDILHAHEVRWTSGGDMACYRPVTDDILVPRSELFEGDDHYTGTLLHECVHWTGHSSRLARNLTGRFGTASYAAEELIAELGAAFLVAYCGIPGTLRHPEYIGSWLQVLKGDKRAVFAAATFAQKAADFLTGAVAPSGASEQGSEQVEEPF